MLKGAPSHPIALPYRIIARVGSRNGKNRTVACPDKDSWQIETPENPLPELVSE